MDYYLVDFENVRTDGVKEIVTAKEGDEIIIYFSDACKNISLDVVESITKRGIKLSCYKAKTGTKNSLDFQLSSHLGYLIGQNLDNVKFHIVSNDKGYDCLCEFWKEHGKLVDRIQPSEIAEIAEEELKKAKKKKKKKKKSKEQENSKNLASLEEIQTLLGGSAESEIVLEIVNAFQSKTQINNAMGVKFKDTKKAGAIYKKLKPLLKEKGKL